jgi:hypothetical protein
MASDYDPPKMNVAEARAENKRIRGRALKTIAEAILLSMGDKTAKGDMADAIAMDIINGKIAGVEWKP